MRRTSFEVLEMKSERADALPTLIPMNESTWNELCENHTQVSDLMRWSGWSVFLELPYCDN